MPSVNKKKEEPNQINLKIDESISPLSDENIEDKSLKKKHKKTEKAEKVEKAEKI